MPITPPEKIKIGYADFPVRLLERVDMEDADGESNWGEQYIKICNVLSHQHQASALLHEIEHLIWVCGDLEEGDSEEKIVTVTSHIRAQVYRDNPQLLSYLSAVFGARNVSS